MQLALLIALAVVLNQRPEAPARSPAPTGQSTVETPFVVIAGYVRTPGRFPYSDGLTVRESVKMAGAVGDDGTRKFTLYRRVEGKTQKLAVVCETPLRRGDVLQVERARDASEAVPGC